MENKLETKKELDNFMDRKMKRLRKKYPIYNIAWLVSMHKALDWYDKKLKTL